MKEIIRSQIVLILNKEKWVNILFVKYNFILFKLIRFLFFLSSNYLKDILNVSQQVEKYLLNKKDEKSKDVNAIFTVR